MDTEIRREADGARLAVWGPGTFMARSRKRERSPRLWVCQVRLGGRWHWVTRSERTPGAYDPIVNPVTDILWVEPVEVTP